MQSGIYKIKNINNNKSYIGSSKDLEKRKETHLQRLYKNNHSNIHLQRAYNIEKENFTFEVLEFCNIEDLITREQYYIDLLKPEYNINPNASSSLGVKRSKETKEKIRLSLIGTKQSVKTVEKRTKKLKGLKRTEEVKKVLSEQQKGNNNSLIKSGKGFDIQIQAMKLANTGKKRNKSIGLKIAEKLSKPIIQLSLNNEFIKEWQSANLIERELGFANSNINKVCSGKITSQGFIAKTAYGFKWKFKTDYEKEILIQEKLL